MPKYTDYKDILKSHFEKRKSKNPSYSLRAFARDIGLLPSRLSDIFNDRQGLSESRALLIAEKLELDKGETEYFINLIQSRHARSKQARNMALDNLKKVKNIPDVILTEEQFAQISDWYFFSILELTTLFPQTHQIDSMAHYLGIEPKLAHESVAKLIALKLLIVIDENKFVRSHFRVSTSHDVPSKAIQKFHDGIISRAKLALTETTFDQRDFSSVNIWISKKDLQDLKTDLVQFRRGILQRYQTRISEEDLYALNINLFPLRKCNQ